MAVSYGLQDGDCPRSKFDAVGEARPLRVDAPVLANPANREPGFIQMNIGRSLFLHRAASLSSQEAIGWPGAEFKKWQGRKCGSSRHSSPMSQDIVHATNLGGGACR